MKNLTKKQVLLICGSIILICLAIVIGYMIANRSLQREPTSQELAVARVYAIDWQEVTGQTGTDLSIIQSLCTESGEETIGSNVYQIYTSQDLGTYLPNFQELMEIAMASGVLHIQYLTSEGDMILLSYDSTGPVETSIYSAAEDTLFYASGEDVQVWTKFRHGFQWGS